MSSNTIVYCRAFNTFIFYYVLNSRIFYDNTLISVCIAYSNCFYLIYMYISCYFDIYILYNRDIFLL